MANEQILTYTGSGYGSGTSRSLYVNGVYYGTAQVPETYKGREEEYFRTQYNPKGYLTRAQVTEEQYQAAIQATAQKEAQRTAEIRIFEEEQKYKKGQFVGREAQSRLSGISPQKQVIGIEAAKQAELQKTIVGVEAAKQTELQKIKEKESLAQSLKETTPEEAKKIETLLRSPTAQFGSMEQAQKGFDIASSYNPNLKPEDVKAGLKPEVKMYIPKSLFPEGYNPMAEASKALINAEQRRYDQSERERKAVSVISGVPLRKTYFEGTEISKYSFLGFPFGEKVKVEPGKTYIKPSLFGTIKEVESPIETRKVKQFDINVLSIGGQGVLLTAPFMPKAFVAVKTRENIILGSLKNLKSKKELGEIVKFKPPEPKSEKITIKSSELKRLKPIQEKTQINKIISQLQTTGQTLYQKGETLRVYNPFTSKMEPVSSTKTFTPNIEVKNIVNIQKTQIKQDSVISQSPVNIQKTVGLQITRNKQTPVIIQPPINIRKSIGLQTPKNKQIPIIIQSPSDIRKPSDLQRIQNKQIPIITQTPANIQKIINLQTPQNKQLSIITQNQANIQKDMQRFQEKTKTGEKTRTPETLKPKITFDLPDINNYKLSKKKLNVVNPKIRKKKVEVEYSTIWDIFNIRKKK